MMLKEYITQLSGRSTFQLSFCIQELLTEKNAVSIGSFNMDHPLPETNLLEQRTIFIQKKELLHYNNCVCTVYNAIIYSTDVITL